jgi:RimJ/RimL family protein N-acetyltransferase
MNLQPVTLSGRVVRLEPLSLVHAESLLQVTQDPEIWQYLSMDLSTLPAIETWINIALEEQARGVSLPFAIVEQSSGQVIGSTRYMDIRPKDRGLEIGWTWLTKRVWRTAVNTECKFMLLKYAFEDLQYVRVQLKTDARNTRSRNAIERIGGQFEGILRKQMALRDGGYRDSAYFSILDSEWPDVKQRLEARLV